MKTLYNTEIETFYTVVDNNNRSTLGDFYDIEELIDYSKQYCKNNYGCNFKDMLFPSKSWVMLIIPSYLFIDTNRYYFGYQNKFFDRNVKLKNMYVTDSRGNIVDIFSLVTDKPSGYEYRTNRNTHRKYQNILIEKIKSDLIIKDHNPNKIKDNYSTYLERCNWDNTFFYSFLNIGYYRKVKTTNTRRQIEAVEREEDEPLFRAKNRNLPDSRDDSYIGVRYTYKSWKHNSKRRKQWKNKD